MHWRLEKAGYNKASLLLAMIGGGKAGNIISPNPNTIAVSEAFEVDLTSLMIKNIIPAVCALIVTVIIATILSKKQERWLVIRIWKNMQTIKTSNFYSGICRSADSYYTFGTASDIFYCN